MAYPTFAFEIAFASNPLDSSPSWTDVTTYLKSVSVNRGRQRDLDTFDAGRASFVLDNQDRRFDPTFTGYTSGTTTLSASGNEITDATRTAALSWTTATTSGSTDGATAPAGYGIWPAATNLFRRGQCDTTNDLSSTGGGTTTRATDATVPAPFSTQSIKHTTDGLAANQGSYHLTSNGLAAAVGTYVSASIWFKGQASQSYRVQCGWNNTDASQTAGATTTFTATGAWQQLVPSGVAVAAAKTGDRAWIAVWVNGTRAESFWTAHTMIESGTAIVTPYVVTRNGSTTTRSAARVQAPVALTDETQCWAAFRVGYGFASTITRSSDAYLFDWRDDANNLLGLWLDTSNKWNAGRKAASAGSPAQSSAQTFANGDTTTVIFACTSTTVKVSVGGGAFTSVANTSIPTLAATLFDIASNAAANHFPGSIRWAAFGTGTLTDANAATMHGYGNTYPDYTEIVREMPSATCTAVWPAVTTSFDTAAPYYGKLLPMKKARLSVTVGVTTYRLFTGYITAWQPLWESAFTADVQIECVDMFDILAAAILPAGTEASELSSARVTWALTQAGIPSADQNVSTGQTTVAALTVTAGSEPTALSHILDVTDSELGAFFIAGDGKATFFDRHKTLKSPYTTSQATFGDTSDSDTPYEAVNPSYDRDRIINKAVITRSGGTAQSTSDATSITSYGTRTHSRAPLLTSDTEALSMGQFIVGAYKDPALRFDQVTIEPLESDTIWALVGSLDVWQRVTVKRTPPGGGTAITQACLIEGVEHRGGRSGDGQWWQTTYRLSPANTTQYLVLDDTVNGVLDTSKLVY